MTAISGLDRVRVLRAGSRTLREVKKIDLVERRVNARRLIGSIRFTNF
jgi:hypothetical protein